MNTQKNPRMLAFDASKARTEDHFTLRDHFAGMALTSLIPTMKMTGINNLCREAYHYADAMLKVREETLNKKS